MNNNFIIDAGTNNIFKNQGKCPLGQFLFNFKLLLQKEEYRQLTVLNNAILYDITLSVAVGESIEVC